MTLCAVAGECCSQVRGRHVTLPMPTEAVAARKLAGADVRSLAGGATHGMFDSQQGGA